MAIKWREAAKQDMGALMRQTSVDYLTELASCIVDAADDFLTAPRHGHHVIGVNHPVDDRLFVVEITYRTVWQESLEIRRVRWRS